MEYSSELQKLFANRIALAAVQTDAAQVLRMLRLTGLPDAPPEDVPGPETGDHDRGRPQDCDCVGIWERKKGTAHFARRLDLLTEWPLWANLGRIEAKSAKRRVVLIGESVARGYLFDPQFTPAMALEAMLQSQMGKTGVEVIDLARVSMGLEIEQLAFDALALEPDVVVIFGGNNWVPTFLRSDLPYISSTLHEHGIPGIKRMHEERLSEAVKALVRKTASQYQSLKVPLVWVIPEFNLGDWRDPVTSAPCLSNGGNSQWMSSWEEASAALAAGNYQLASEFAEKMVALDEKTCVAGLHLLADCALAQGDTAMARQHLECARDALIWSPSIKSPRIYSAARQALRAEAEKYGNALVDLPQIFSEYLDGGLPGRRLFLDYCHLTSEGIQLAMSAAAACVLRALGQRSVPLSKLIRHAAAPASGVEAEAAFLAAVHNAHWHQSCEIARYYCGRALKFAPGIAQVMVCFMELQTRRAPALMCRAAEEIAALEWPSIQNYLLRFNQKALDRNLLNAVGDALKDAGIDAAAALNHLRLEEHSVTQESANLLDYYYSSSAVQSQEEEWSKPGTRALSPRDYYKAYSPVSRFFFVGKASHAVRLSITCRVRSLPAGSGAAVIAVNGQTGTEVELDRAWSAWDITVPAQAVRDGLNEVSVRWPCPDWQGRQDIEAAAADVLHETGPEFYGAFGEIHSFIAAGMPQADRTSDLSGQIARIATERI